MVTSILPELLGQNMPQVLVGPPFDFAGVDHWTLREKPLPNRRANPLDVLVRWEKDGVLARRMSQIAVVYSGEALERVGVTRAMARRLKATGLKVPAGVTGYRITAPAVYYVPANLPHTADAAKPPEFPETAPLRMLVLQFTEQELRLRLFEADQGGTHHLSIADPYFIRMERSYARFLARREYRKAQGELLALLSRLLEYLRTHAVPVSSSSWPSLAKFMLESSGSSRQSVQLCYKAVDYIQFHLHAPLTAVEIAAVCGVTYMHLNRVFREVTGLTVMRFVTQTRLNAARSMLKETDEQIGDIANLLGFASLQSFSLVFARHEGLSPRDYRRAQRGESPA